MQTRGVVPRTKLPAPDVQDNPNQDQEQQATGHRSPVKFQGVQVPGSRARRRGARTGTKHDLLPSVIRVRSSSSHHAEPQIHAHSANGVYRSSLTHVDRWELARYKYFRLHRITVLLWLLVLSVKYLLGVRILSWQPIIKV